MITFYSETEDSSMNHIQKYPPRAHSNLTGRAYLLKARRTNPIINFNLIVRKMDKDNVQHSIKSLSNKVVNFMHVCPEMMEEKDPELRGALAISVFLSLVGSFCKVMGHDEHVFKEILQQAVNVYRED
jgi:hypothetical protein